MVRFCSGKAARAENRRHAIWPSTAPVTSAGSGRSSFSYTREIGPGQLSLSGLYVLTDRKQTENSIEYNDPVASSRDNLLSVNEQIVDIDQRTQTLEAGYRFEMAGGRTDIDLGYSSFKDDTIDTEEEVGYDDEETPPPFDACAA